MFVNISQKRCSKCGETKPLHDFAKDKRRKDGRSSWCLKCNQESTKKWKIANPDKVRDEDCRWRQNNPDKSREKSRKWRSTHPEAVRASDRQWAKNNPDKVLAKSRNRRAKSKDLINAQQRKWRSQNPDKVRSALKKWASENIEKIREMKRRWTKSHPEKELAHSRNRRAKIKGNGGIITASEWEYLKKLYNYTCLCCGRKEPEIKLTLDHVVPIVLGGTHSIDNAQCLCGTCNSRKGGKYIDYRGGRYG